MTACIEAGTVGKHLEEELEKYFVTLGHEPDSIEFSTLGGWIATKASGMKKNKYGNIEDLLLAARLATYNGEYYRPNEFPRESAGPDFNKIIIGSEGNLGIISEAIVKISHLPEVKEFESVILP